MLDRAKRPPLHFYLHYQNRDGPDEGCSEWRNNGNRLGAWKIHLQQVADQIRIPITVCHYPPGTSKWNKIERRLFSFFSFNRRGQPLINYETIVNLIGGTKTRTGLKVQGSPRHE